MLAPRLDCTCEYTGSLLIFGGALPPLVASNLGHSGRLSGLRRCKLPSASFASAVQEPRGCDLDVNPTPASHPRLQHPSPQSSIGSWQRGN
eukprot:Skav233628  [mRNA]  locus=scaffold492:52564:53794:- [translate_table: standard]